MCAHVAAIQHLSNQDQNNIMLDFFHLLLQQLPVHVLCKSILTINLSLYFDYIGPRPLPLLQTQVSMLIA